MAWLRAPVLLELKPNHVMTPHASTLNSQEASRCRPDHNHERLRAENFIHGQDDVRVQVLAVIINVILDIIQDQVAEVTLETIHGFSLSQLFGHFFGCLNNNLHRRWLVSIRVKFVHEHLRDTHGLVAEPSLHLVGLKFLDSSGDSPSALWV